MVIAMTVAFSDFALQIIVGAIAGGIVGRAMRGGGFGLLGDLLIGAIGAIAAVFVVSYFALFNIKQYGLTGELIVAAVGAILLVVVVHKLTSRKTFLQRLAR